MPKMLSLRFLGCENIDSHPSKKMSMISDRYTDNGPVEAPKRMRV